MSAQSAKEALDDIMKRDGKVGFYPLYFPLVIDWKRMAALYATRLDEDGYQEVVEVCSAVMTGPAEQQRKK